MVAKCGWDRGFGSWSFSARTNNGVETTPRGAPLFLFFKNGYFLKLILIYFKPSTQQLQEGSSNGFYQ